MSVENWQELSRGWRRVKLPAVDADGAWQEVPRVNRHLGRFSISWGEEVYALPLYARPQHNPAPKP